MKNKGLFRALTFSLIFGFFMQGDVWAAAGDILWKFKPQGEWIQNSSPAIGRDGTIYVGSLDGNLYALDVNGNLKWRYTTNNGVDQSPAIGIDGSVYFVSGGTLFSLSPNGEYKWKFEGVNNTSPTIGIDNTIYIGGNKLYALNDDGTIKWEYLGLYSDFTTVSISGNGSIIVGANRKYLLSLNAKGSLNWAYSLLEQDLTYENHGLSVPSIDREGTAYIGAGDHFFAIKSDGTLKWKYQMNYPGWVWSSSSIDNDGTIYFPLDNANNYAEGYIYALTKEGNLKWQYSIDWVESTPTIGDDGILYTGNMHAFYPDGSLKWHTPISSTQKSSPALKNGVLYVGGDYLYAIDTGTNSNLANTPWPKFYKNNQNTSNAQKIGISPSTLKILDIAPGSSGTQTFDITNVTDSPISVTSISSDNPVFTVSQSSATIPAGGKQTVTVTFRPTEDKGYGGKISIKTTETTLSADVYGNMYPAGEILWQFSTNKRICATASIGNDGTVYIPADGGYLYAFNEDGSIKWRYQTGSQYLMSSPLIGDDDTIYLGVQGNSNLFAFDSEGLLKWKYTWDGGFISSVTVDKNGIVYGGSTSGYLNAINTDGSLRWKFKTDAEINFSPVVGPDGTIYVGSADTYLYAVTNNGDLKWKFKTDDKIKNFSIAIDYDGSIYFSSLDKYFYALNPNGTLKWKYLIGGDNRNEEAWFSPVIGNNGIIYTGTNDNSGSTNNNFLYAFTKDGMVKWKYHTTSIINSCPVVNNDGTIIFSEMGGCLNALSPDGVLLWSVTLDGTWNIASPAISDEGVVYIGTNDGTFYAIGTGTTGGLADSSWPKFHHDARNTGSIQKFSLSASALDFGMIHQGETVQKTFTIMNYDTSDLTVSSILSSDPNYTVSIPSATVAPNQGKTVSVTFAPKTTKAEPFTGTVTIMTNYGVTTVALAGSAPPPTVTVTAPNGGEKYESGKAVQIKWQAWDVDTIAIEFSKDNGATWETIKESTAATSTFYTWAVPTLESTRCLIRLTDLTKGTVTDTSDAVFTIAPPPSITLTSPNGGEKWIVGSIHDITWTSYSIEKVWIEYTLDGGSSWRTVSSNADAKAGKYSWTVPNITASNCRIKISDTSNGNLSDTSNAVFTITPEPFIQVTAPNGGEKWWAGSDLTITWASSDVATVKIEVSKDGGTSWATIAENITASKKSYTWTVPETESPACLIRISDTVNGGYSDVSDGTFGIISRPTLTVTSPNGDEKWISGSIQQIMWSQTNVTSVKIEFSKDGGETWTVLTPGYDALSGAYSWTVASLESFDCRVRVTDAAAAEIQDTSDGAFTVSPEPFVQIVAPNSGETLVTGDAFELKWNSMGIRTLMVEFSDDNGTTWRSIARDFDATTHSLMLEVPFAESNECILRLIDLDEPEHGDVNDAPFSITVKPEITLTSPNGGEQWEHGSVHAVTWTSRWVTTVMIEYSADNGATWTTIAEGVEAESGTYNWTTPSDLTSKALIRVTDEERPVAKDVSDSVFSISPEPYVLLLSPNGGESLTVGSAQTVTWGSFGVATVKVEYSSDGGGVWQTAGTASAASKTYTWLVPNVESERYLIRISDTTDAGRTDTSDGTFTVLIRRFVQITSPNGSERWERGSVHALTWEYYGPVTVDIEYTADNGATWTAVATGIDAVKKTYTWTVPDKAAAQCLLRITDSGNAELTDTSDAPFAVIDPALVKITAPNGGEVWQAGSKQTITWQSSNAETVTLQYSTNGGTTWTDIAPSVTAAAGSYSWTVPDTPSTTCLVKAFVTANNKRLDVSDNAFTISPKPFVALQTPNGGETWSSNSSQSITWQSSGVPTLKIEYSLNGGVNWMTLAATADGIAGSFAWRVPNVSSTQCIVRITDTTNQNLQDVSEATFTISPAPFVEVTSPNGGEDLMGGTTKQITWTSSSVTSVKLEYSSNGGSNWIVLTTSIDAALGRYDWTVPAISSSQCLVRITDVSDGGRFDISDGAFTISPPPTVTVTAPNGGEKLTIGTTTDITWSSASVKTVRIEYSTDNGVGWTEIVPSTNASTGKYTWTVPNTPSSQCLLRVTSTENLAVTDRSEAAFAITTATYLTLERPNGDESFVAGTKEEITWATNDVKNIRIEYTIDGGITWVMITSSADARTKSYLWSVPDVESTNCLVRITDSADANRSDMSNAPFGIAPAPFVEIVSPSGGESWPVGMTQSIQWTSKSIDVVALEYTTDNGQTWHVITASVEAENGSYAWTVPDLVSNTCRIRISDAGNPLFSGSSRDLFSIIPSVYLILLSPAEGDELFAGRTYTVTWEYRGVSQINIEYSTDNGSTWEVVVSSVSAQSGVYSWKVPDTPSIECRLRITSKSDSNMYDINDGMFRITTPLIAINHDPVPSAFENSPITFTAQVTSETAIDSVYLCYDVTGRRRFITMKPFETENGTDFSLLLPIGVFTASGMEYFITAKDKNGIRTRIPEEGNFFSVTASVESMVSSQVVMGGSEQTAYRMISVPLVPLATGIEEQLDGLLPPGSEGSDWRLFRYPNGSPAALEYPNIEGFGPGKAFWLITTSDFTFTAPKGETVTTAEPFTLTLAPGWNDIANPWMFEISWDDKENPSSANLDVLYTYEGGWSDPSNPPIILKPWEGYSVRNLENYNVVVRLQPNPVNGAGKPSASDDDGLLWRVAMKAYAGEAMDAATYFGVDRNASVEWDNNDHVEPPGVGQFVSVVFPHTDWLKYPYDYTVDMRPPEDTISWDFDVRTNIANETVTVVFNGFGSLPPGVNPILIDLDTGNTVDIGFGAFSFLSGQSFTEHHYRITVSGEQNPQMPEPRPEMFVTATCFPNPFNPQTTIRYELSHRGRVTISVFNSLGQEVARYNPGNVDAGIHEQVFDAKGVTSGLYVYRIDAGYASVTGKMVYMK